MSDGDAVVRSTVREHLHATNGAFREVVAGLTADDLDWRPGPETNSIAVLVTHTLDSERFLTAFVAGIDLARDREATFRVAGQTADDLSASIDEIERVADRHIDAIADDRLAAQLTRGTRTASGAWWLLHAMGHAKEHLGQAELMRQLVEMRRAG